MKLINIEQMNVPTIKEFFHFTMGKTTEIPVWEIFVLLLILGICLLLRMRTLGLLIAYAFSVYIAWNVLKLYCGSVTIIVFAVISGIVLLLGLRSVLSNR